MDPVEFDGCNTVFAKDQPQYRPLPAMVDREDPHGLTVICWKLTPAEIVAVMQTGIIWQSVCTFNQPLQPQCLQVAWPEGMQPPAERGADAAE